MYLMKKKYGHYQLINDLKDKTFAHYVKDKSNWYTLIDRKTKTPNMFFKVAWKFEYKFRTKTMFVKIMLI
jgi:hypothetical protein